MLIPNHPDDERLSALAARDADAIADAELVAHVDACSRCASTVRELGVLRTSLAELPDIPPSRPLRLLPPVEETTSVAGDRLGGWVRRLFSPALAAGVTLAFVGLVGTVAPGTQLPAGGAPLQLGDGDAQTEEFTAGDGGAAAEAPEGTRGTGDTANEDTRSLYGEDAATDEVAAADEATEDGRPDAAPVAERSPWPMVLFTGVALVIGAILLRWILAPRAG